MDGTFIQNQEVRSLSLAIEFQLVEKKTISPKKRDIPPTMKIFSTGSLFTSDMVGGEIRIPSQSIIVYNPKQYIGEGNVGIGTGFQTFPAKLDLAAGPELEGAKIFIPDYTASIERVVNDKEIHVKEPFWFQYGDGVDAKYYLADFGNHPYAPIDVAGSPRADFFMSFIETTTA